ncbi:MAG: hypothetical protein Q7T55_23085 [Solirubrobacteraceae bacterium]|nr:hypothetical protein [Solirubrobacteraceae bacterium]
MRRSLRRTALLAVASVLPFLTVTTAAHAGYAVDKDELKQVGPGLTQMRTFEGSSRNNGTTFTDQVGYSVGPALRPGAPTATPGMNILSQVGHCDGVEHTTPRPYYVKYEPACNWNPPSDWLTQPGATHGITDFDTYYVSNNKDLSITIADGRLRHAIGGSTPLDPAANPLVYIPRSFSYRIISPYDPVTCRKQNDNNCSEGVWHSSVDADGRANAQSVWHGPLNMGANSYGYTFEVSRIATSTFKQNATTSAQSIDIFDAGTDNFGQLLGSADPTKLEARRLCAPSRIAVGDVSGNASTPREIVRFGPDCSGYTSSTQFEESTASLPNGIEVWKRPISTTAYGFSATSPKPVRLPTYEGVSPKISDLQLADLNADGQDDFIIGFSSPGGYAIALSGEGDPAAGDLAPAALGYKLTRGTYLKDVPVTQVAARDISTTASRYPTPVRKDVLLATSRGLIALENDGGGELVPYEATNLNAASTGAALDRAAIVAGPVERFTFGQVDNDTKDDLVTYDGTKIAFNHGVSKGPTITKVEADRTQALTGDAIKFTLTQTTGLPADTLFQERVARVRVDLDNDGKAGETGEPVISGDTLVADGFTWTPNAAGTFRPDVYVENPAGESTKVTLGYDINVTQPLTLANLSGSQLAGERDLAHPWNFAATVSGGTPPYTYAWTATGGGSPASGTAATFAPIFSAAGSKTVSVTVKDALNASVTKTQTIRAADPLLTSVSGAPANPPQVGDALTLTAQTSGGVAPYTHAWSLGTPNVLAFTTGATGAAASFDASGEGVTKASVAVKDASDTASSPSPAETTITVVPKLAATFLGPTAPEPGMPAVFSATGRVSGGFGGYTYAWSVTRAGGASAAADFTAGGTTGATFSPTFTRPGSYAFSLRVTDGRGRFVDSAQTVKVAAPLTGTIDSSNTSPQAGETVDLTARPTGGVPPYTYRWDDDTPSGFDAALGTAATASVSYPTPGSRTVTLEVTDASGVKADLTRLVGVAVQLTADFTIATAQPAPGQEVLADGGDTRGGKPPYAFAWTLDGALVAGQTGPELRRTFTAPGRHTLSLTVTDDLGRTDGPVVRAFKVAAPVAPRIDVSDEHPQAGGDITLDASGSTGGLSPRTFSWDLDGDGVFETTPTTTATRTLALPSAGVRTVGLKVTDDDGVSETTTRAITATVRLKADLTATPSIARPDEKITFSAAGTSGGGGPSTYAWDLDGNGTFETTTEDGAPSVVRAFSSPADVTASVRATDPYGHSSVATARYSVAPPLTASLTAPLDVEVGDDVALDASASAGGVGAKTYAYDLDGNGSYETDGGSSATTKTSFKVQGAAVVKVLVTDARGQTALADTVVRVAERLDLKVASTTRIATDSKALFDARDTTGGTAPLQFSWDLDGDGSFEQDGRAPFVEVSYPTVGKRTATIRVTDAIGRTRSTTRDIEVVPACTNEFVFPMGKVTAEPGVCLRFTGSGDNLRYVSNGSVRLNGQLLSGSAITIIPPTAAVPGGRIQGDQVKVVVQGVTLWSNRLDWKLPDGVAGEEFPIVGIGLPENGVKLLGLEVQGRLSLAIGISKTGTAYVRLRGNLAIPSFKISPEENSTSVTGAFSLRIDKDGVHTDNVLMRVESAYLGSVKVNDVCLSYLAAGIAEADSARCEQFEDFRGAPFLTCASDDTTERWDGTVDVTLPGSDVGLAASGGLANGSLSSLALKGEFARQIPLKPGVAWLKGIAAGVCLKPQLKIKGSAKIGVIPKGPSAEAITASGSFEYNDAYEGKPWSITVRGGMDVMDRNVGDAYLGLDGDSTASFGWKSGMSFPGPTLPIATIDGSIDGWIELGKQGRFNVEGNVRACVVELLCASGQAVVSTEGVSACITLFEARIYYPVVWPPDYDYYDVKIRGGFGYRWGNSNVSVMAASCDIGPWRAKKSTLATRSQTSGATRSFEVAEGQPLAALRVAGDGAVPKITLRGPNGETISSDPAKPGVYVEGKHMLYEDEATTSTQAMVFKPAPGVWTVEAQAGSTLKGELEQADYVGPTSVYGKVDGRRDKPVRTVDYAYSVQPDTTVRLVELGVAEGARQTLGTLKPGACPAHIRVQGAGGKGPKVACGKLSFRPTDGKGGQRKLQAEILRGGVVVDTVDAGRFEVSAPRPLGAATNLQMRRTARGATTTWSPVRGAVRYDVVTTQAETGTVLSAAKKICRRSTVLKLANDQSVTITVRAVDAAGKVGLPARVTLKAKKPTAGPIRARRAGC